jgi:hypothetical protein
MLSNIDVVTMILPRHAMFNADVYFAFWHVFTTFGGYGKKP